MIFNTKLTMVNKAVHFNLMMNSKVDKEGTGTQWNTAKCGCERVFVIATYAAWYWEVEKKSCQRDNDPHHLTKHTRLSLLPKIPSHFYSSILFSFSTSSPLLSPVFFLISLSHCVHHPKKNIHIHIYIKKTTPNP